MYRSFENYSNKSNNFEQLTLEDFAKTAVSHDSNSVNNILERIHTFVVPKNRGISDSGLLTLLQKSLEVGYRVVENIIDECELILHAVLIFSNLKQLYPGCKFGFLVKDKKTMENVTMANASPTFRSIF